MPSSKTTYSDSFFRGVSLMSKKGFLPRDAYRWIVWSLGLEPTTLQLGLKNPNLLLQSENGIKCFRFLSKFSLLSFSFGAVTATTRQRHWTFLDVSHRRGGIYIPEIIFRCWEKSPFQRVIPRRKRRNLWHQQGYMCLRHEYISKYIRRLNHSNEK